MIRAFRNRCASVASRGFTLLEMLVVLVIIGLIAGLVGPQLIGRVETSKVTTAQTQVRLLKSALDTMRLDIGRYPTKDEGLEMLMTAPKEPRAAARWQGPYLAEALPLDPWGNAYQYAPDGNSVILYSFGADGRQGGEGNDADIGFLPKGNAQQQASP
jgi:general secretion pathway protein G